MQAMEFIADKQMAISHIMDWNGGNRYETENM